MELLNVLKRLKIAGFLFVSVMLGGTLGYYLLGEEGTTWMDALYMTGITISTLGYHEVIPLDTHPYGRLFTLFLIFFGFAVLTYLFSNLIALFIEGDLRSTFIKKRMQKQVDKMNDHYIICGCGRVGRNVAYELMQTEREFVIADKEESGFETVRKDMKDTPFIAGDCTDDAFLMSLGINRAKGIFVVTGEDNTNLVICLTARQLNPQLKIVGRIKEIAHANKMHRVGADRVVSPNYIGGIRMAAEMLRPAAVSFMDELMRSEFDQRLEECVIPDHMNGQPLSNFPVHDLENTTILALREQGTWHYSPSKSHEMKKGEHLVVITTPSERKVLEKRMN